MRKGHPKTLPLPARFPREAPPRLPVSASLTRRLSHLLQTIKKATGPKTPCSLSALRLYLRVCRLRGSQGRQGTLYDTGLRLANRFYEAVLAIVLITCSALGKNSSKSRADTSTIIYS